MKPKKVKSVCVPLNPDDCGSVVSGYVRFPELSKCEYDKGKWSVNYTASVSLSDCSKVINWHLTNDEGFDFDKLGRAIDALEKLRDYMIKAQLSFNKLNAEKEARNKASKKEKSK